MKKKTKRTTTKGELEHIGTTLQAILETLKKNQMEKRRSTSKAGNDPYQHVIIYFEELLYQTAGAWKVLINKNEVWFPRSVCSIMGENAMSVPAWMVNEKGLA